MGSTILSIVVHVLLSNTTTIIKALMVLVLLSRILGLHLPCPIRLHLLAFIHQLIKPGFYSMKVGTEIQNYIGQGISLQ